MSVDAQGPAQAAGIMQGDVIASLDGRSISGVRGILNGLAADSIGSTVAVSLRRAGEPIEVRLTVGERPKD